jgi:myo-inositol-1(or 4)-monophosphatase
LISIDQLILPVPLLLSVPPTGNPYIMANSPLSPAELREVLEFTTEPARKAGALMLEGSHAIQRGGAGGVGEKKNAVDLVTEYDVKVEDLVRGEIARACSHFQL